MIVAFDELSTLYSVKYTDIDTTSVLNLDLWWRQALILLDNGHMTKGEL